jgi:S-adenosylmethionine decarboxylase
MKDYSTNGVHFLVEYFGCRCQYLNNAHKIDRILRKVLRKNDFTIKCMDWAIHYPQGRTITAIIEESSVTITTWPEKQYLTINLHTCGGNIKGLMKDLRRFFRPHYVRSERPYIIGKVPRSKY